MEKKQTILNRKNQKIVALLEKTENQKGLAFVMHGLGGFKEQDHIKTFADAFKEKGFTVIRFDTTNSLGESYGKYEDATITNYLEDLEDVIGWSSAQDWYEEPFWLTGHSLGGISVILFAEKYPNKVKGLAPISTVISGELTYMREPKERREKWDKTGWKINPSKSKPGVLKKLKWHNFVNDSKKYNVLPEIEKLTMSVLLITGDRDNGTPPQDHKMLFNKLKCEKELHIIKGAPHTFKEKNHLVEIKGIFKKWIKNVKKNETPD